MKDEEARREAAERARYTGPDGEYVEQPPSEEALRDLVDRANTEDGSWVRASPSGFWLDTAAMGREILALRGRVAELEAVRWWWCPEHGPVLGAEVHEEDGSLRHRGSEEVGDCGCGVTPDEEAWQTARREGAASMRSEVLSEIRAMYGRKPLGPGDDGYNPALDEHVRGHREALDTLAGIVETLSLDAEGEEECPDCDSYGCERCSEPLDGFDTESPDAADPTALQSVSPPPSDPSR